MTQQDEDEYLTPEEAASILGVSRRTVDRYATTGKLRRYRKRFRVMFLRTEVEALREEMSEIRPEDEQE